MAALEELQRRLAEAAAIGDPVDRRLLLAAIITERLKEAGVVPIVVGGAAVEFYTAGGYSTTDVDLIAEPSEAFSRAMSELGFTRTGRFWSRPDLTDAVETPAGPLAGDVERVTRVEVEDLEAYVIGIEDLIVDRLNAYVHWQSEEDGRWARRLASVHKNDLDLDYLRRRASEEHTADALCAILRQDGA